MVEPAVAPRAADLRAGLLAGAAALCVVSRGDFLVVAALLAVVAGATDTLAAAGVLLAGLGLAARSFSTSLSALAGSQAVLGLAGLTAPPAAALSAWAGAAALLSAAPAAGPGWSPVPFGLAAGLLVAGPSGSTLAGLVVRLVAAVAFADLALSEARWLPTRRAAVGAVGCGLVSVVVGLVARPAGGWHWGAIVDLRSVVVSVVAAVIIAAGVVAARWWLLRRRAEPVSG